jgi:2-polyprenyl-3-methyl-5-hydroxy-6-metoxy-1,4-benzoquinol methylase
MSKVPRWLEPDERWDAFVEREPYFAVLTAPKFRRANLTDSHLREFFASGERLADWIFREIDTHVLPEFAPASILDYGAGIGRLSLAFASRAGSIVAVDRSEQMLHVARREANRRSETIEFQTPRELFSSNRQFDLVSTISVFQHMRQDEGLSLFQELLARVRPEGIGVFHFPSRLTTSPTIRVVHGLRNFSRQLNALLNVVTGKDASEPFRPVHAYDLGAIFDLLSRTPVPSCHVAFEHQSGFDGVFVFVRLTKPVAQSSDSQPSAESLIRVTDVIASRSIEDHNQAAEEYFASLSNWDHHLAKPFNNPHEAPHLLMDVATALQGLKLMPGMTVLDFGAGTGWLARILTQLGCRVVLLDVSPTALKIARQLYQRIPIAADNPNPEFSVFNGYHIDLEDASVDRVVSFHAFHHVPNPSDVMSELGRVLRPGGIAAFVEPGPHHSETALSQFEMRTYGVVESDIDITTICQWARAAGLAQLRLLVSHQAPFYVSPSEYDDFLAGGAVCERWVSSTRLYLRGVRNFLLCKEGTQRIDSRSIAHLACGIQPDARHVVIHSGEQISLEVTVRNTGRAVWLASETSRGGVWLGAHLYDEHGTRLRFDFVRQRLADPPADIPPGNVTTVSVPIRLTELGRYIIEFDCVSDRIIWFAQCGSIPSRVTVEVTG